MKLSTILLIGLSVGNVTAKNLRETEVASTEIGESEHLDLEVMVEGQRQLFPLLPGTKCPTGHTCRSRTTTGGESPMIPSLKRNYKTDLSMSLDWVDLNANLETVVMSDNRCTRRQAMARAAGLAAGLGVAAVSTPAYAAETKEVKMGSDSGLLAFVPAKINICKGDTVKWINNKGGPHNVVFDEDAIPAGVNQESISMIDEQIGEEGESYSQKFTVDGNYAYYCEPHRGAGMNGVLVVA